MPADRQHELTRKLFDLLLVDFANHGAQAIQAMRQTKPSLYLNLIARVRTLGQSGDPLDDLTEDELSLLRIFIDRARDVEQTRVEEARRAPGPEQTRPLSSLSEATEIS